MTAIKYSHRSFRSLGTQIDLWIGGVPERRALSALADAEEFVLDFDDRLSRFKRDSELSRLNRDQRETVEISPLMLRLLDASLWAAEASGGLVDPTIAKSLRRAGYTRSRDGAEPASLAQALAAQPRTRVAQPNPDSRWREISLDRSAMTVSRPFGIELDSGGCGKGLAADMIDERWRLQLGSAARWVIDCGGDVRIGGTGPAIDVGIEPPVGDLIAERTAAPLSVRVNEGAVATSGLGQRIWRNPDGSFAHHLIDPASGRPAWTGVAGITQLAPTALIAETMAKMALLSGPGVARELCSAYGGVVYEFDGSISTFGDCDPSVEARNQRTAA